MNSSDRRIKLNRSVDQITISSASLDKWIAQIVAALVNSNAKSRAETASSAFGIGLSKSRSLAVK